MRKTLISTLRWTLFGLFLTLGIIGILLPVIPQVPFLIAAFVAVAPESRWVRRKYFALRVRFPRIFAPLDRWRDRKRLERQEMRRRVLESRKHLDPDPKAADRPPVPPDPRRSVEVR